jgi:hypothetical protein
MDKVYRAGREWNDDDLVPEDKTRGRAFRNVFLPKWQTVGSKARLAAQTCSLQISSTHSHFR